MRGLVRWGALAALILGHGAALAVEGVKGTECLPIHAADRAGVEQFLRTVNPHLTVRMICRPSGCELIARDVKGKTLFRVPSPADAPLSICAYYLTSLANRFDDPECGFPYTTRSFNIYRTDEWRLHVAVSFAETPKPMEKCVGIMEGGQIIYPEGEPTFTFNQSVHYSGSAQIEIIEVIKDK